MAKESYTYKFSFVMPIYNVEKYLREAVDSVIHQDIGFEENVEIIFVNDGSPDNSEEICLEYKHKYPNNIIYIKQENAGLSAARNRGIDEVRGKYVSFMDSDDIISPDTLSRVFNFFEEHYASIDFVSIKQIFFEAKEGEHPLGYKFASSRVIDIETEYDHVQLSACSSFVKSEVFAKYKFDAKIRKFAEDVKFLTEVVQDKKRYGVVAGPIYYYRQRSSGTSIIDSSQTDRYWYFGTPNDVYTYLFDLSKERYGFVTKYVQYIVMYDLQWRFRQQSQSVLSDDEVKNYKELLFSLIEDIDADIIIAQKDISTALKAFILQKKYKKSLDDLVTVTGHRYIVDGVDFYSVKTGPAVGIQFINRTDRGFIIEGLYDGLLLEGTKLAVRVSGKDYIVTRTRRTDTKKTFFDEIVTDRNCYKVEVDAKPGDTIEAVMIIKNEHYRLPLWSYRFTGLDQNSSKAYAVKDDVLVRKSLYSIQVKRNTIRNRLTSEFLYQLTLVKHLKVLSLLIRLTYFSLKPFHTKKIWLVSDRINAAGDNGEALFRYLQDHTPQGVQAYFTIAKDSSDYKRMATYGKVVDRSSLRYRFLFLLADKVISSHADDFVINAFGPKEHTLRNLYNFDFVFLQHGITKDDISKWLNRYNKNIKLFVAAAKPEYDSLLGQNYGYTTAEVKLTGFPRYDLLDNNPQNKIIIAPTWRRGLTSEADQSTGVRLYNTAFKNTDYYQFYQALIGSTKLIKALQEADMIGEFYLHPSFASQIKDFQENDTIAIKDMPYSYSTAFSEGNILITDFSSVAFDFAYLKKPIVYSQFDRDSFFQGHLYSEGYFSYEKNGFGPVGYDSESTIDLIIKSLEARCVMEDKYVKRVDAFFNKFDKKNSERVCEAILNMNRNYNR